MKRSLITKEEHLVVGETIWVNGPINYVKIFHNYCGPARIARVSRDSKGSLSYIRIRFPIAGIFADKESEKSFVFEEVILSKMERII